MPKSEYIVKMKNPLPFRAPDASAWSIKISKNQTNLIDRAAQSLFTSLSRSILNEKNIKDIRFQVALCKDDSEKKIITYSADIKNGKVKIGGGSSTSKVSIKQIKCGKLKHNELVISQIKPKKGGDKKKDKTSGIHYVPLSPYYPMYPFLYDIYAFGDQEYIDYWTYNVLAPFWWLPNFSTYFYWDYFGTPIVPSVIPTIEDGM